MKTRFLLFAMILSILFFAPVFGQDTGTASRLIDNAGIFSEREKSSFTSFIDNAAQNHDFDLVIVTENSIGSSEPGDWANSFFDNNGYGFGRSRDGCLLLIFNTDYGWDFQFSDSGRAVQILNDFAFNKLEADVWKYLEVNDFSNAAGKFFENWMVFLELDAKGRNYNFFFEWNVLLVIGSWVLALLTGCTVVMGWKKKMNTAQAQTQADAYTVQGSLSYKEKKDRLLFSNVTKIKRQTQSSSGSSLVPRNRRR